MNKAQIVKLVSYHNSALTQKMILKALDLVIQEMANGVRAGSRVEIRGFGTFTKRAKNPRLIVHPMTKKRITAAGYNFLHYAYTPKAIKFLTK